MREVASKELRAPSLWSAEGGHLHERFRCNWVRSISIPIPPKWLKSSLEEDVGSVGHGCSAELQPPRGLLDFGSWEMHNRTVDLYTVWT